MLFNTLNLSNTGINTQGAEAIANALIKRKHGLWIDYINPNKRKSLATAQAATQLTTLDLSNNDLGINGVQAICNILSATEIPLEYFVLVNTGVNSSILENCGVISSSNKLEPPLFYLYLARFILNSRDLLSITIKIHYQLLVNKLNSFSVENE